MTQEGAIGAIIEYIVLDDDDEPLDISSATVKALVFKKPDGTVVEKTAVFVTNGTDGKLKWTTIAGDLTPYGTYSAQARLTMPGFDGRSQVELFDVLRNL